ncbi:MAG: hypothetical protein A3E01_19545 [Gammaproteobacteria bacterium RIFCSPHIGHO2_12_FULL_63_22]|nr:MAG: hypothetical protein A3E01_19545 [Gammaproteobacteria bacterium RIFCSPHIGHO2_12_FULL_63_22]
MIGAQHEALLRSIGGNLCDYCSKRGSPGCAWETTTTASAIAIAVTRRVPAAQPVPREQSVRQVAAEVASHLGP